ncbi:MAG TPA: hypothetical protein VJ765_02200 [Chitinophagaceae bacterium]|nr:hypothetical protein [Chitinophagaceae bacterium]
MKQFTVPEEMKIEIDYAEEALPNSVKLFQPLLYRDGNSYCCVLGPDPATGVFGSGDTPIAALKDWDTNLKGYETKGEDDEVAEYIKETLKTSPEDVW